MSWVETAGGLQWALREGGAHWIGLMSGFWRGGQFRLGSPLLSLSLSLSHSLSLHSHLLFTSGERFSIYDPRSINLESTAIPISFVASGSFTITLPLFTRLHTWGKSLFTRLHTWGKFP